MRTSRSRTGAVCTTVGQVLDGELGLLGLDRRFRALPAGAADTCSTPQTTRRDAGRRAGLSRWRQAHRADRRQRRRRARGAPRDRRRRRAHGAHAPRSRSCLPRGLPWAARAGAPARRADRGRRPSHDAALRRPGRVHRRRPVRRSAVGAEVLASADQACAASRRSASAARTLRCRACRGPSTSCRSSVPPRCGRRTRAFVAIRRFVPRNQRTGRVVLVGSEPGPHRHLGSRPVRRPAAVVLTGAGAPQPITVDARRGGFLAVLNGRVTRAGCASAPTAGRSTRPRPSARRASRSRPRPFPRGARSPPSRRACAIPEPYLTKRGSVAISRRADDPTGGPAWALRSWAARINPRVRVSGGGGARDLLCFAIGIERGDRLVEPRAGGATRTVGTGLRDGRCNAPDWLTRHAAGSAVRTYVDDPESPDPKPVRLVISGPARVRRAFRRAARRRCPACARAGADAARSCSCSDHSTRALRCASGRSDPTGASRPRPPASSASSASRIAGCRCGSPTPTAPNRGLPASATSSS